MTKDSLGFGRELRRRRLAANLTLERLAILVHYSKAQLSKVERGIRAPNRELAALCDAALEADGALSQLVGAEPRRTDATGKENNGEEVWLMELSPTGKSWFRVSGRHRAGAADDPRTGMSIGRPEIGEGTPLLGTFRSLFDQYRTLNQSLNSGLLIPGLIAQTNTLRELSAVGDRTTRDDLSRLGARYAEFIGWLVQETGDDHAALWWTHEAVKLAAAGGDHDFGSYGLVRRSVIALYQDDAEQTIDLARRAQRTRVSPRIRGLAAQHEAQGHALTGDRSACMASLDRSRELLAAHTAEHGAPMLGPSYPADPAAMTTGWCLYDLGRPRDAAEVFDAQLTGVPPSATRTRVRYGARRALAYAAAGEIEHACALSRDLITDAAALSSATVAVDLRRLARTLSRYRRHASVRELAPDLGALLRTTPN